MMQESVKNRIFECKLVRCIDGDTLKLSIDLGFRMTFVDNIRLIDIDTPEMNTTSGKAIKALLVKKFSGEWDSNRMILESSKHGKYRWVGLVHIWDKTNNDYLCLNKWLVSEGYARSYKV